jgi:hypothetical protein
MRPFVAAVAAGAVLSLALTVGLQGTGEAARGFRPAPQAPMNLDTQMRIDVNLIDMFVTNVGSFAWDLETGLSGLTYPKGTNKQAVFASGIWIGARVGGQVRTEVAEYSQEYVAGPIVDGSFDPNWAGDPRYKVYKMVRWSGAAADAADTTRVVDEDTGTLLHDSWSDYRTGAIPFGAPARVYRVPDPGSPGDSIDVVGPDVLGDQMLWSVYNDMDEEAHSNNAGASLPLGLEIQQTTFGFNRQGPLGEVVFLKFKLINKGTDNLEDTYVAIWSDPDLGSASDDLVGCDTALSMGYCYNATNSDGIYGAAPPAVGYDFFRGPRVEREGQTVYLGMSSFNKYINGTDPSSPDDTYNYMLGLDRDGTALVDPSTGEVTTYSVSGDPVLGTGWLDSNPADRRLMLSSGPFAMAPGDTQEVVAAVVMGQGNSRLSSVTAMKFNDFFAQDAFDKNFDIAAPPPTPVVDAVEADGKITLSWGVKSQTDYDEPGYVFEGYNVYQGASIAGPWKRIATYDLVNGVRIIYDDIFDPERGYVVNVPVQYGADTGLSQYIEVTQDAVRGGELKKGTTYYFAVTAYGVSETEAPRTQENAISSTASNFATVTPQSFTAETVLSDVAVAYSQADDSRPPSTDHVEVTVVDPYEVNGHDYRVLFRPADPPFGFRSASGDSFTVLHVWDLVDQTSGTTVLRDQFNKLGDENYLETDGFIAKVIGNYRAELTEARYVNANPEHRRALDGVSSGGRFFNFSTDYGLNWWYSSLDPEANPDTFTTVEIRFSHERTQKAYSYIRLAPGTAGRYHYRSFDTVPFTAWSVVPGLPERQLNVCYVENDDQSPGETSQLDNTWGPDASASGAREYLFILSSTYSDTPDPFYTSRNINENADEFDILYAGWWRLRDAADVIDDGDKFLFQWATPATDNDTYDFSLADAVTRDAGTAKGKLSEIKVVPNPYFNRSTYELDQFNRRVKFTNLPARCTIRIFNLAGDLLRTLEKTEPTTSILEWDLLTDRSLPVASGIYVWHVEAPGIGQKVGKMAVFVEKERLNTF